MKPKRHQLTTGHLPPVRRAEQNELEQYFASNYLITLPYHSAYWIGYQARTWGVNNFIPLDRWAAEA